VKQPYDAVLLVSLGGPEKPDDVIPFLENVVRGKHVPEQRLREVAEHYYLFDGTSPINAQVRALLAALVAELNAHGPQLPVYWGNRNWHPLLPDTLEQMAADGVHHALAFVTSAFGSYPGCRQYQEDIERARQAVGSAAPRVDKLRLFYNHPGFIEPMAERAAAALEQVPAERRPAARIVYSAHSIPVAMADKCRYREQLHEACRLVSERVQRPDWQLAYQSRSGRPSQPWLEPAVGDCIRRLAETAPAGDVVIVPVGYLCENMEILYDLDLEMGRLCEDVGWNMVRSAVVATHPRFVTMIRELILERIDQQPTRLALGKFGPSHDVCPPDCCPPA